MKGILYLCSVVAVFITTAEADLVTCPDSDQSFHAHPNSCSKFIECNNGEYREIDCIEGFHFNPALGFCDLPENVGCELEDVRSEEADLDDGDEEIGNGEVDDEESGDDELDGDDGIGDGESDVGEDNGENGVEGGEDEIEDDGENNGNGGDGGDDDEVGDGGDDDEVGDGGDDDEVGDGGDDDEIGDGESDVEEDTGDNDVGGEGDGGSGIEEDEDQIGGGDSSENDVENGGDDNQSNEDGEWACPATGQHWFPHRLYCSQFIECHDGIYTVVDCIPGLHFNPSLGFCDFPENVGCVDSTLPPTTTTTTEVPNIGGPVGECPALNGEYVDFLTDSLHCDVFYKCNWGTPIKFTCGAPLHFNPELNVCDWPENVGCTLG